MRHTLLLLVFLFAVKFSTAQDSLRITFYMVLPEYNAADGNTFSNFIDANNYPSYKYWPWTVGIGTTMQWHNFRLSTTGMRLTKIPLRNGDTTVVTRSMSLSLEAGYDVLHYRQFRLFPFAGFKITGVTYDLKIDRSYTLGGYVTSGIDDRNFSYTRSHVVFGLGMEWGKMFYVGIKSGIYVPVDKGRWSTGETQLDGGPAISYKYFANASLGFRLGG
jgi:hypothetical protein